MKFLRQIVWSPSERAPFWEQFDNLVIAFRRGGIPSVDVAAALRSSHRSWLLTLSNQIHVESPFSVQIECFLVGNPGSVISVKTALSDNIIAIEN